MATTAKMCDRGQRDWREIWRQGNRCQDQKAMPIEPSKTPRWPEDGLGRGPVPPGGGSSTRPQRQPRLQGVKTPSNLGYRQELVELPCHSNGIQQKQTYQQNTAHDMHIQTHFSVVTHSAAIYRKSRALSAMQEKILRRLACRRTL